MNSKLAKYVDIFIKEAESHLKSLQDGLLKLEREKENADLVQELMRNAHTIKGSSRMLGFDDIGNIAHKMEDYFRDIKDGKRNVSTELINLLLKGRDTLEPMISACLSEEKFETGWLMSAFERGYLEETETVTSKPDSVKIEPVGRRVHQVDADDLDRLQRRLAEMEIVRRRLVSGLSEINHKRFPGCTQAERIEKTLQLIYDDSQSLELLLQDISNQSEKIRMLPLSSITDGFERTVRDLAIRYKKDIRIKVKGGELLVDRLVLEELKPAFIHLITNSVAHGIETEEQRMYSGKSPCGEILIKAEAMGERLIITVCDDGKGMDHEKIRDAAVQKGIMKLEEVADLDRNQLLNLTLLHGFSTEVEVGEIAGRGVGLDVVAQQLKKIKGEIEIKSEQGAGCEIIMNLPQSLLKLDCVIVTAGRGSYAIPSAHISETMHLSADDFSPESGRFIYSPELPVISLVKLFSPKDTKEVKASAALILKSLGNKILCLVDEIRWEEEVVLLKLSRQFVSTRYCVGTTMFSDGAPVFILNVEDIVRGAVEIESNEGKLELMHERDNARWHILVVDDSSTSRNLETAILQAQGFHVTNASCGMDALNAIESAPFDLIVTDYEMPDISGVEMTRRIRMKLSAEELPVIMVTSLDSSLDKMDAVIAGVQAFLVKGEFDQDSFLKTVHNLIK